MILGWIGPFRSCTKSFSVSGQQRLIEFILLFIEVKNDFFLCPTYVILIIMTGATVMTVEDKLLIISSPFNSFNKDTRKLWFQKHLFKSLGQVSGPCVWQRSSGLRQDADEEAREPGWSANSGSKDFHVSGKSMKIACSSHRFGRLNGSQWDLQRFTENQDLHVSELHGGVHVYTFLSHVCWWCADACIDAKIQ